MKRAFLILIATIFVACSSPADGSLTVSPNLLFGAWTNGSVVGKVVTDHNLSFREDRTCRIGYVRADGSTSTTVSTCDDCIWKLEGDKLTITVLRTSSGSPPTTSTMEIDFPDANSLMFVPTNTLYKRTTFSDGYTCK